MTTSENHHEHVHLPELRPLESEVPGEQGGAGGLRQGERADGTGGIHRAHSLGDHSADSGAGSVRYAGSDAADGGGLRLRLLEGAPGVTSDGRAAEETAFPASLSGAAARGVDASFPCSCGIGQGAYCYQHRRASAGVAIPAAPSLQEVIAAALEALEDNDNHAATVILKTALRNDGVLVGAKDGQQ